MKSFEYRNPVKVIFGSGTFKRLGEQAAAIGGRALLVSYADHAVLRGVLERARAQLTESVEHGLQPPR